MQVREAPGSKRGHIGVYSDAGELLFVPQRCVAAVLTDRSLFAWCAPRFPGDGGQARGGPWFVEVYRIPSDPTIAGDWPFVAGYEIRNRAMMGWCWAVRIKAPKKYKFEIVVLEGRSEDFRDAIHVVLHDDGRFSETHSLEAAQRLLSQPPEELARWSGDYSVRILGEPMPHWGLLHDAFHSIWIEPDTLVPAASTQDHPRAESTRRRLFPFGERERLTLSHVGTDPAWLGEQPEFAPVQHLTIHAPYVSKELFQSLSLWVPWFRARRLGSLAFGEGKDRPPFISLHWRESELVCTLAYATEQLRKRTQEALDGFLAAEAEPLVDVVEVLGGGLDTGNLARRVEAAVDHAKLEKLVADVQPTLAGEVLHLKRRAYASYHFGNPFPAAAFGPALERHWLGNPKQLRAELRVAPEDLEAFWPLCARRGIELLQLQTEENVWYRRTQAGWCSQDGFLEVVARHWLPELPDPAATKIRLHLDTYGIKVEDLLEEERRLLWQGYDVCLGPSHLPYVRVRRASEFVSTTPKPPEPPSGKLVELVVHRHGAGYLRLKYLKRAKRLECASSDSVEAPTPHTLAATIARNPPPGPVKQAAFKVPLLGLAWCLGEWLQLSSLRQDLALPELELVQFTTKAKGAPVSELRYADGGVEAVLSIEHLGSPSEVVLEILQDLPEGAFRKLRVEHEQPLPPELQAALQRLSSRSEPRFPVSS